MAKCEFCSCRDESTIRTIPASMFGQVEEGAADQVALCVTCYLEIFMTGFEPNRVEREERARFLER